MTNRHIITGEFEFDEEVERARDFLDEERGNRARECEVRFVGKLGLGLIASAVADTARAQGWVVIAYSGPGTMTLILRRNEPWPEPVADGRRKGWPPRGRSSKYKVKAEAK